MAEAKATHAQEKVITSQKVKTDGQKQIFNNKFVEALTRTHIAVPLVIFYSFSAGLLYMGTQETQLGLGVLLGLFVGAFLFFTLVEYLVHRYVFHMLPTNKLKDWVQYNFHGVHHEFPRDKKRLVMPPVVSFTLAVLLFFGLRLVMGDYTFGFLPGFLSGYASYLAVHYIVHAFRPPNNFLKELWVHHGIHHYKDHTVAYGVSSPLWDWVFRTMPKRSK